MLAAHSRLPLPTLLAYVRLGLLGTPLPAAPGAGAAAKAEASDVSGDDDDGDEEKKKAKKAREAAVDEPVAGA
jgi:hypothetical protein